MGGEDNNIYKKVGTVEETVVKTVRVRLEKKSTNFHHE